MIRSLSCAVLALSASCGGGSGTGDDTPIDASIDGPVDAPNLPKFSFFATSLKALRQLSGNQLGFGGDLRFGETGPGAGLRGADKICTTIAETSMPGSGTKIWHAFLSVSADANGQPVNAIDRIGDGPWYDRTGRLLSPSKAMMLGIRPAGGDPTIMNDFPNEDGVPNHNPDGTGAVDNHDFLTGANASGGLYAANANCLDWTANAGNKPVEGRPRVGHSWPRGGGMQIDSWMSSLTESGCAPSVDLIEMGPPSNTANTVGNGGGYGGFYCFALTP
jgi:hypothetical protein